MSELREKIAEALRDETVSGDYVLSRADAILALLPDYARGYAAAREDAAQVADNWTDADHIAHDIRQSHFPRRSPVQDAIASAIRALEPKP